MYQQLICGAAREKFAIRALSAGGTEYEYQIKCNLRIGGANFHEFKEFLGSECEKI